VVLIDEPTLQHGAELDLELLVVYIACDIRLGLQFNVLGCVDRADHGAVDDHMRDADLAFDLGLLREHQGAGLPVARDDAAAHMPVHPETAGKGDVAFDRGAGSDQAVDAALRLAVGLGYKHAPLPQETLTICVSLGALAPFSKTRTCMVFTTAPDGTLKVPSTRWKNLKLT